MSAAIGFNEAGAINAGKRWKKRQAFLLKPKLQ